MSIYSGFPTRKDQSNYNKLLVKLITTMQDHILDLLRQLNQSITIQRAEQYIKIVNKLKSYQEHKYLPPKFSEVLENLQTHIEQAHKIQLGNFKVMQDRSSAASIKLTEVQTNKFKSADHNKLFQNRRSKSIMGQQPMNQQNYRLKANSTHYRINHQILNRMSSPTHQNGVIPTEQNRDIDSKSRLSKKRNLKMLKDGINVEVIQQISQNHIKNQYKKKNQLQSINRKLKTQAQ